MNKLKVGVIGVGKMGILHGCIFNCLDYSTLSAICEKKLLISTFLKKYIPNVNIYSDFRKMLEKKELDIIVITTPVFLHKTMIESAMEHDLHIFVEKPLAMNSRECISILSKSYEKKSLVGYCRRFMETYNLAKKIIKNSYLGKVNYFHSHLFVAQVFSRGKGWQYNPKMSGGGVLMDLGSHTIDLFHYLFGDIDSVRASGKSLFNGEVEDYVSLNLKFQNGIFGSLQLSWSVRNYRLPEMKIEMHLDGGLVTVTEKYIDIYSDKETEFIKKGWNTYYKQNLAKDIPINIGGSEYTSEDFHFLNCIINNKKTYCDFREAAKVHFVLDKIYSSIEKNEIEKVKYGL